MACCLRRGCSDGGSGVHLRLALRAFTGWVLVGAIADFVALVPQACKRVMNAMPGLFESRLAGNTWFRGACTRDWTSCGAGTLPGMSRRSTVASRPKRLMWAPSALEGSPTHGRCPFIVRSTAGLDVIHVALSLHEARSVVRELWETWLQRVWFSKLSPFGCGHVHNTTQTKNNTTNTNTPNNHQNTKTHVNNAHRPRTRRHYPTNATRKSIQLCSNNRDPATV